MSQKLRGLVAQGMNGKKKQSGGLVEVLSVTDASTGSGTIIATKSCVALIYLFGPGGSGAAVVAGASGAGGGSALFKRIRMTPGQLLAWAAGTPGALKTSNTGSGDDATDTTVTAPAGLVLTAGGGKKGTAGAGGAGGIATGGDINRNGGAGGTGNTGAGGSGGTGGGGGGVPGTTGGGGGGGAGFLDLGASLPGGAGTVDTGSGVGLPNNYGGGGGGTNTIGNSGAGGLGRVLIWLVRTL